MKISNSKKELARIISENGGWRDGAEWSIQDRDKNIEFMTRRPEYMKSVGAWYAYASRIGSFKIDNLLPNFHQTILSRAEYFHLYPAPDAKPQFCESVMRSIPGPDEQVWTNPPTIEQLAADYRNAKDYAERKQQEADDAKADAGEKLRALELAGEALGLVLSVEHEASVITPALPQLIAGDWRSWRQWEVGDLISWSIVGHIGEFRIISVHHDPSRNIGDFEVEDKHGGAYRVYGNECRFIRRP